MGSCLMIPHLFSPLLSSPSLHRLLSPPPSWPQHQREGLCPRMWAGLSALYSSGPISPSRGWRGWGGWGWTSGFSEAWGSHRSRPAFYLTLLASLPLCWHTLGVWEQGSGPCKGVLQAGENAPAVQDQISPVTQHTARRVSGPPPSLLGPFALKPRDGGLWEGQGQNPETQESAFSWSFHSWASLAGHQPEGAKTRRGFHPCSFPGT